ncbi:MAG TPA: TadE family protein [Acidimicrobiia bacterium]|nr:TadE family protein [Acidimicrobiia bacterium]
MRLPLASGRNARSRARSDRGRGGRGRARRADGQATVEFALLLPLLFGMLVLLIQLALVARDEILVVHAARDAAREATLTSEPDRIVAAARRTLEGSNVRIVRRGVVGDPVEIGLTYVSRTDLPLVGPLLPDITLHATAVMRVERP